MGLNIALQPIRSAKPLSKPMLIYHKEQTLSFEISIEMRVLCWKQKYWRWNWFIWIKISLKYIHNGLINENQHGFIT